MRTAVDRTKPVRCLAVFGPLVSYWYEYEYTRHASTTAVQLPYARTTPRRSGNQLDSPDLPRGQALKSIPHAAKVQTVGCRELDRSIEFADLHGENSPQLPVVF